MPRREIAHNAGTPIADDLRELLNAYFSDVDLQRLERLGGRVVISIAAPYISKSQREASKGLVIDSTFIERLKTSYKDAQTLQVMLENLSERQLRSICRRLGVPIRSRSTLGEIRADLTRNLQAEDLWRRISGGAKPVEGPQAQSKKPNGPGTP